MPEIQFINVSKHYNKGKVVAVDELSLDIHDGEYLSLLGPSGCGKTTTLRMLSGLTLPTKGQILWDGKPVEHTEASERDIGYVFQQFAIFPHLNVYENIAFGPEVKGFSNVDIEAAVEEYMKIVGLADKSSVFPKSLDAADLQRVGIARVLATGAKTLLLDEPMGALDHKIRERFQDELVRIVKELNLTAIHVTHDQSEAMAISDRIGVMKKGKMIQIGSPNELLYSPTEIFTAHFIGEADFLTGVVQHLDDTSVTVQLIGDELIEISRKKFIRFKPVMGERVIIGVRREFFEIQNSDNQVNPTNSLRGNVMYDRYLGEKRRVKIELDYGRELEVKRHPFVKPLKIGKKVDIFLPSNAVFLFRYPTYGLDDAINVT